MNGAAGRPLSVLLVTQFAPPVGFSAARRSGGFTKYLGRLGHRVTLLTSLASGTGLVEGAERVIRTRDLITTPLNWRRGHFQSIRGGSAATYSERPSRLASIMVPDLAALSWLPFALPRAVELARRIGFDCVFTTSPPESAHFVGLALKQRFAIPWIADLQDGWTFESTHPEWPLSAQAKLDVALERLVACRSDLMVGVTDPLTDDLRSRLGVDAVTITNGFDPEETVPASKRGAGLDPQRFSLVYTGRLAFAKSTPKPLVAALLELRRTAPELARRLEVVFAGPLSEGERELLCSAELEGMVRTLGNLPREDALALQAAADALLLVIPPARTRSVATAKLYEYLAAGRPILVLGEDNAAADTVRELGAGRVTAADDPRRIAGDLSELISDGQGPERASIESYSYPVLAGRLAEQMERLARRSA